jgi:hypothetical protein
MTNGIPNLILIIYVLASLLLLNSTPNNTKMSFYFAAIGTKDNPIYETEFGTSKQGGDGT